MELILWLLVIQGIMGAFDLVYHHEITEKLTWKPTAAKEMLLHGVRNGLYAVVFFSLGFVQWHGVFLWPFVAIVLAEVTITLWDFVIEDQTRKLPATERVTHTLLALNYGAVLGLLIPQFVDWHAQPTGFALVNYGLLSWLMALYALGVLAWFFRDTLRSIRLYRQARVPHKPVIDERLAGKSFLVTGGSGFIGAALCNTLIGSGAKVTVLTRKAALTAEKITGRVTFIDSIERLDNNDAFDVIINLAGEPIAQRWTARAKQKIMESRIGTTEALVNFIHRADKKPALFISGSAIGFYGVDATASFDENSTPASGDGGSFAKEICQKWESAALAAKKDGVRTVLLRTGVVLEKDGGTLSELLFPFDFCVGGRLGTGQQWFSWIHRNDLIGIVLHIVNHPEVEGVINCTAPQPVKNADFAKALGRAMKRPSLLPLPGFVLLIIFGEMADEIMLNGQKVLPEKAQKTGYKFQYSSIQEALESIFFE